MGMLNTTRDFRVLIGIFSNLGRSEILIDTLFLAAQSWIIDPKGLDSSKKIHSRRKSTTVFNLPNTILWYVRLCQRFGV